jgi:TatD DNase family protein
VDAHAHLEDPAFANDVDIVLKQAEEAGVDAIVTAGSDLASSRRAVALAGQYEPVYAAVGFHPHEARKMTAGDIQELRDLAAHPKVVAIGEIGLDFYRNHSPREAQFDAFRQQLTLAAELGLPVVVHARDAEAEVEEELTTWAQDGSLRHALLHCFSGDLAQAERYAALGFLVSFAGPVTYPKNDELGTITRRLPLSHMAIETDAPYLPPQGHRGHRNEPAHVAVVAERIAALRGLSFESIAEATSVNAASFFKIPLRLVR